MKIRDGFILRDVGGKTYVVATGELTREFNGMITLNETGKFIWQQLQNDVTSEVIVDEMTKVYEDADRQVIEQDVLDFIAKLEKDKVLE